jgi:hypothetical protein
MKVKMKKGVVQYSGKAEGLIFYYHPGMNTLLARRKPKMPHQPINDRYRKISLALKAINPSPEYRQNFKEYLAELKKHDDEIAMVSWHNLFVKMMWNLAAKHPAVKLETLTRAQIVSENLPCRTLKTAVEADLLPMVGGYKKFTAGI